jgi:hypothetical protein
MSNLSQKQRDALPDSAFCGPNRTYPVLDASDVRGVASLIGQAAESAQAGIKACAIKKAKRFGWPIPQSWKEESSNS